MSHTLRDQPLWSLLVTRWEQKPPRGPMSEQRQAQIPAFHWLSFSLQPQIPVYSLPLCLGTISQVTTHLQFPAQPRSRFLAASSPEGLSLIPPSKMRLRLAVGLMTLSLALCLPHHTQLEEFIQLNTEKSEAKGGNLVREHRHLLGPAPTATSSIQLLQ